MDYWRGNPEEAANKKADWKMPRRKQQNPQPVKCKLLFILICFISFALLIHRKMTKTGLEPFKLAHICPKVT